MIRNLHVFGPLLGIAGFALAFTATSPASAQDTPAAPPAGSAPAATTAAPAATDAPPAPATTEDPNKKKAAAADTTAPAPAATATTTETGATVTFGGNSTPTKKDEPSSAAAAPSGDKPVNALAGSIFIFDQSSTTNSFSKGSQLSYVPVYEWWLSPRVYYNLNKKFKVGVRQDFFKEWTNSEDTTYAHEWRYTDTWLTASYSDKLKFLTDKLKGGISWTLRPGISKESRGVGQYLATGPGANLSYSFDIGGEKAKVFKNGSIGASVSYQHAFTRCTTACNSNFAQPNQDLNSKIITSDQVRSGTLTGNTLLYALFADIGVADKLDFSASMIWISSFAYQPTDASIGGAPIARGPEDTHTRQYSWFLVSLTYDVMKEFDVGIGYYNLNNVLAPDGSYREPFWSPDARVFLDVTFKIDAIVDRIKGTDKKAESSASAKAKKAAGMMF